MKREDNVNGTEERLGSVFARCLTHAVSSREVRQVGFVLLQVIQAVHMLNIHLQLPEVLGQDPRTWMQDAPQVRFGQLLPLVQRHRAWFGEKDNKLMDAVLSRSKNWGKK